MIRVERGPEPLALAAARQTRLAVAVAAFNNHGAPSQALSDELKKDYGAGNVKETLFEKQHKKCAWCEPPRQSRRSRK